jgi:hypothetical protein
LTKLHCAKLNWQEVFCKKREIEKKMAVTADKINLITIELAGQKHKMKVLQRQLAELDNNASDM